MLFWGIVTNWIISAAGLIQITVALRLWFGELSRQWKSKE